MDRGCLAAAHKQRCRTRGQVAVLTHLRSDMKVVPPFETEQRVVCSQGQALRRLGHDARAQEHWFGAVEENSLCAGCWEPAPCPRQFVYPASAHQTLPGKLPLNTRAAQYVLKKVRPGIEPAQSYEKNQLGWGDLFLNSLPLAWCWGLLADAVCLLPARALRTRPPPHHPLVEMLPWQLTMDWDESV